MEHRKEYAEGEAIFCPKCSSADVDYDDAPTHGKCNKCGLEFEVRTVLVWEE